MLNILILSVGTRNKLIQYFRKSLFGKGKVIATDMQTIAPAVYEADKYYIVPQINDPDYIDIIIDICKREKITGLFSLIDPELSILAANENRFREIGATVIGSSYSLCEMAINKMQMHDWLVKHGYKTVRSYDSIEYFYNDVSLRKISFPVFVKPQKGSASVGINKARDKETLDLIWKHSDGLMIQEYMDGIEIGADVYIDLISNEVISIFTKKKLLMRAGETDKAVSFKDPKLFDLIERFVIECGWKGQIDIDIFKKNGEYYISEINPRFGGGYPHACLCGCNYMEFINNNLNGITNMKSIGKYEEGIYMMKYNEIITKSL